MSEPLEPDAPKATELRPQNFPTDEIRPPHKPVSYWRRRFLACNPFYICSAALLLYGLYPVSVDPHFLNSETGHLFFNFSALQLYEILLVTTAIFLAGRSIWYDSMLLVGLENMLVLVPFLLVSQAALIDARIVRAMCLAGGLLAIGRFESLRRFIFKINFPPRLVLMGLLVLAVNTALPIIYRILHQYKFGTKPDWGAAYYTNEYAWFLALPILCALVNFVPFNRSTNGPLPSRGWWPLACFALWLLGTGVHLYCLGYVYDFGLRPELLAPAIWMLCWMAYRRTPALFPRFTVIWHRMVLCLPAMAALLGASGSGNKVLLALAVLNTTIYQRIYSRHSGPRLALHLLLLSLATLVAGLPQEWCHSLVTDLSRAELIGLSAGGYLLICTALSRNPKVGIFGAAVAFLALGSALGWSSNAVHWSAQACLAFLQVHSLRWPDAENPGAMGVRVSLCLVWIAHAFIWMSTGGSAWMTCAIVTPVLGVCLGLRLLRGHWGPRIVPIAALLVALSGPADTGINRLQTAPIGILAIVGSLLLFVIGTLAALAKARWHEENQSPLASP